MARCPVVARSAGITTDELRAKTGITTDELGKPCTVEATDPMARLTLFDAPVAVCVATKDMVITHANQRMLGLFGYDDAAELLGQNVTILMPHSMARCHGDIVRAYLTTRAPNVVGSPKGRHVTAMRRDGSLKAVVLTIDEQASTFVAAFQDVSEFERLRLDRDRLTCASRDRDTKHDAFDRRLGNYINQARKLLEAGDAAGALGVLDDMQASSLITRELELFHNHDADASTQPRTAGSAAAAVSPLSSGRNDRQSSEPRPPQTTRGSSLSGQRSSETTTAAPRRALGSWLGAPRRLLQRLFSSPDTADKEG